MTTETVPVMVKINASADDWRKLQAAKARASAANREAEAMEKAMGIPSAPELAKALHLPAREGSAQAVIVDGNGTPLGKLSVFWFGGSETPPSYRRRIS